MGSEPNVGATAWQDTSRRYRGAEADNLYDGCQHRQSETRGSWSLLDFTWPTEGSRIT